MKHCKRETLLPVLFTLLTAVCFLTICSRSSFLYVFNNWDDANSYFSMGKTLMNGGVLYRDAFDQKGPLLYFIYGIGYLLSHTTFHGVFLLEILFFTAFLMAEYKILCLYIDAKLSLLLLPLSALAVTVSKSFYWGGCAEEFCLPLLAWGLYFSLRYFQETYPKPMSYQTVCLCGGFAGCILLIKFNILGFYFAWMAVIGLANFRPSHWRDAIRSCVLFLAGMLFPVIPWILYFGSHQALADWYKAYIYCNVFLYSDLYHAEAISIGKKVYDLAKIMYYLILDNGIYFVWILLGFAGIFFSKRFRWLEKLNIYAMFGFLFVGIYIGGTTLFYYSLPLSLFSIFGIAFLGMAVQWLQEHLLKNFLTKKVKAVGVGLGYLCLLPMAWNLSMNTEYAQQKTENFWLYEFRNLVLEEKEPTLLNISCLDAGLYTVTDILPTCQYFQSNAVHGFDEVAEEQLRYIRESQTEFVLARDQYPEAIWDTYTLVSEQTYRSNGTEFTYYLFQRK